MDALFGCKYLLTGRQAIDGLFAQTRCSGYVKVNTSDSYGTEQYLCISGLDGWERHIFFKVISLRRKRRASPSLHSKLVRARLEDIDTRPTKPSTMLFYMLVSGILLLLLTRIPAFFVDW